MIKFCLSLNSRLKNWELISGKWLNAGSFIAPYDSPHLEYYFVACEDQLTFLIREKPSGRYTQKKFINSYQKMLRHEYDLFLSEVTKGDLEHIAISIIHADIVVKIKKGESNKIPLYYCVKNNMVHGTWFMGYS